MLGGGGYGGDGRGFSIYFSFGLVWLGVLDMMVVMVEWCGL